VHVSARSQGEAAARQTVLAGWTVSGGQLLPTPSQLSAASQPPTAARHTAVLFASAGQAAPEPLQCSTTSHTPAGARHCTLEGWKESGGQLLLTPSQLSATSQTPAEARQRAVLFASPGQKLVRPSHTSARSQLPAEARHTLPIGFGRSGGQALLMPVQNSSASHVCPADAARHTTVAGATASGGHAPLMPLQFSAGSQPLVASRHTSPAGRSWQFAVQHELPRPFAGP
jgi:hypothetical protein